MPPELIDRTSTRARDTAALLERAEARYAADHGYPPRRGRTAYLSSVHHENLLQPE